MSLKGPPAVADKPSADLIPGSQLGKYEILKRLAVGGMAEIFLARARSLPGFEKVVVIKRILPQLAQQRDFVNMFLDEARIAATLQHPNVVQVYDVGMASGNYFIAMEYLHGEDVRSLMRALATRATRLPLEHALNIVISVAAGLHYAHDKVGFDGLPLQIVHRDVSPQNVIVTFEGTVKLLDFGVAKAQGRAQETRAGTLKGKVAYMSPEQCIGDPIDRRADVFALGIMLYELTLHRRLFRGKSDYEVMKKITEGLVPLPRTVDPSYDSRLESIVMKALSRNRERRFATAWELQVALEDLIRDAQLYVSATALKQFMERLFGNKLEAWREAQAKGKSLMQHLAEQPLDGAERKEGADDDVIELTAPKEQSTTPGGRRNRPLPPSPPVMAEGLEASIRSLPVPLDPPQEPPSGRSKPTPAPAGELSPPRESSLTPAPAGGHLGRWLLVGSLGLSAGAMAIAFWPRTPADPAPGTRSPKPPPTVDVPAPTQAPVASTAVTPPQQMGIAKIITVPPGATVYLDGVRLASTSPLTVDRVSAGSEHTLLLQLAGYRDLVHRFTVPPSDVAILQLALERELPRPSPPRGPKPPRVDPGLPEPAPHTEEPVAEGEGVLILEAQPWCDVSIDGHGRGPTPLKVTLPAGRHTLLLTNPEFSIRRSVEVVIQRGQELRKKFDFGG